MKTVYINREPVRFWQAGEPDTRIDYAALRFRDNHETYYTTHTIELASDFETAIRAYMRGDGEEGAATVEVLASRSRKYPRGSTWSLRWDMDGFTCWRKA